MSHAAPLTAPSIPSPNDDPKSVLDAVVAIKQNIEISQHTRGRTVQAHRPTTVNIELGAALTAVKNTLP